MTIKIGLAGIDSSHAEDFIRLFNLERRFDDTRVTALWCHAGDASRAAELSRLDASIAETETLAALAARVDCVVVGCRDGRLHKAHALAAIAADRAVFVDKPLATNAAEAVEIVRAAERAGIALGSASALRWQKDTLALKARLAGMELLALEATGTWYPQSPYGGAVFYAIHTVELVQELLGTQFGDVRRVSGTAIACTLDGVPATLRFAPPAPEGSHFSVTVRSAGGHVIELRIGLPDDYMAPVAARLVDMVRTGVPPLSADQLLAPARMMEAIETALA